MRITKKETKLMAFILTFVMMLSGLVCVPERAAAATSDTPSVKVLGATLRLDAEDSQTLRIGIEISNASKAKNCGIELKTADGKSVTVQTGEGGANNIYDYNEATDKVIYTVALTGIDTENFGTEITATGKVEPLSGDDWITETADTAKSVNSVVKSIKEQMGKDLYFDGATLVQKVATYDFEDLTESEHPEYSNCSKLGPNDGGREGSKCLEVHSIQPYGGYTFSELPSAGEYTLQAYVKKLNEDDTVSVQYRTALSHTFGETLALTNDWQLLKTKYVLGSDSTPLDATDKWGNRHSKILIAPASAASEAAPAKYLIDDVEITKKVTADDVLGMNLARDFDVTISENNQAGSAGVDGVTYADDTVSATFKGDGGGGGIAYFIKPNMTPIVLSDYSKVQITLSTDLAEAPLCVALLTTGGTGWWTQPNVVAGYPTSDATANKDTIIEYNLKDTKFKDVLAYRIKLQCNNYPSGTCDDGFGITIKSIKFIA